jgi:hypothetical protein
MTDLYIWSSLAELLLRFFIASYKVSCQTFIYKTAPYKESGRARITKLWLLSALSHKLDKITTKLLLKSFLSNILQNDLAPLAREVAAPRESEPKSF